MGDYIFPFVTSTPNPVGGCASGNHWGDEGFKLCSFCCEYCWASDLKTRFKYPKYQGPWRIIEKELKSYSENDFPWACNMIDIGDPTIPSEIIVKLLKWIDEQPCPVLLLTKNPVVYIDHSENIPHNLVLGVTIESDKYDIVGKYSKASVDKRFLDMYIIRHEFPNKRFICVEPVMDFTEMFIAAIRDVDPWRIACGFDNYGNKLEEPSLEKLETFLEKAEKFTKVYRKSIRERWDA